MAIVDGAAPAPNMQQHKVQEGSEAHNWLKDIMCSSSNARQLLLNCKSNTLVCNTPHVKVWKAVSNSGAAFALKWWSPDRVEASIEQCGAEARAAHLVNYMLGEHWPCISLPVAFDNNVPRGACTISVYAGDSLDTGRCCVGLGLEQRLHLGRQAAATMLMAQEVYESLPAELGGALLNRDMKLANMCHRVLPSGRDLFTVIDHGGICYASGDNYFGIVDQGHIDSHMAAPYGPDGQLAAESREGLRAHTHPTIDKYSTGLAVVELVCGHLPRAVDWLCYDSEQWPQYLAAIGMFDWATCEEVATLPAEAQDFVCWLLARNLQDRPQSATEALQHPWITGSSSGQPDAIALVAAAADEAAAEWSAAHEELDKILGCDDQVLQRVLAITTAAEPAVVPLQEAAALDSSCGIDGSAGGSSKSSTSSLQSLPQ